MSTRIHEHYLPVVLETSLNGTVDGKTYAVLRRGTATLHDLALVRA